MMTLGHYLSIAQALGRVRGYGEDNEASRYVHQLVEQSERGLNTRVRSDDTRLIVRIDRILSNKQR